ncbi:MAG TPA: transglycosylase family protein [Solirubrobacterales bacterium]|nr:transglycosylase family protein [Solirubrobacterales bacterium]
MRNTTKRKMTVAALSCVATLATGAGTAHAAQYAPFEPEPREQPKPKPEKPQIPQPQNGAIEGVSLATLNTIAACESGGDPTAVNAAGYYGKYQFDLQTWAAVGGSGNPAEAPEAEQDYRAALLYAQSGSSPWPVCGV